MIYLYSNYTLLYHNYTLTTISSTKKALSNLMNSAYKEYVIIGLSEKIKLYHDEYVKTEKETMCLYYHLRCVKAIKKATFSMSSLYIFHAN